MIAFNDVIGALTFAVFVPVLVYLVSHAATFFVTYSASLAHKYKNYSFKVPDVKQRYDKDYSRKNKDYVKKEFSSPIVKAVKKNHGKRFYLPF